MHSGKWDQLRAELSRQGKCSTSMDPAARFLAAFFFRFYLVSPG